MYVDKITVFVEYSRIWIPQDPVIVFQIYLPPAREYVMA